MKSIRVTLPKKAEAAYVLPIGDLHIGDQAFGKDGFEKLKANLEWATVDAKHPVRIILMGDIFNFAGRNQKTSPFESDPDEVFKAEELFEPYAPLIVGAIRGNHERRVVNEFGYDPLALFCRHLKIPYMGVSGVVRFDVGSQSYDVAVHHSTGGGGSIGNALNQATKLESVYTGCDAYLIGHNHQLTTGAQDRYSMDANGNLRSKRVVYVCCGSYLAYAESYAEEAMMKPGKMGSPRLRLNGLDHDLHVSV
jgi:hypothetical protein